MKKTMWAVLGMTVVFTVMFQLALQRKGMPARIKVENEGGIITGVNESSAGQYAYDPYFIPENNFKVFVSRPRADARGR